jgi:hypothetical protein
VINRVFLGCHCGAHRYPVFVSDKWKQLQKHMNCWQLLMEMNLCLVCVSSNCLEDWVESETLDESRSEWLSTSWGLETVKSICELVAEDHWMTLNLMDSQLHMKWEMGCLILYKTLWKVSSAQPLRSAAVAQSQDLQRQSPDLSCKSTLCQLHVLIVLLVSWSRATDTGFEFSIITQTQRVVLARVKDQNKIYHLS